MGKNGYLERQKLAVDTYRQAERDTYIQFMTDTLVLTLNDPDVMGKDVFGKKRIMKVVEAWAKTFSKYEVALTKSDEADYFQEKLDDRLAAILGRDTLVPFSKRYDWVKDLGYKPKRKK